MAGHEPGAVLAVLMVHVADSGGGTLHVRFGDQPGHLLVECGSGFEGSQILAKGRPGRIAVLDGELELRIGELGVRMRSGAEFGQSFSGLLL